MKEKTAAVVMSPDEWRLAQLGYERLIDSLDARGIIDRDRVGIVGWSRSGPYVGYTLTHSEYPFAAAAFAISGDFGWYYYVVQGFERALEMDYGAAPFGEGMAAWM